MEAPNFSRTLEPLTVREHEPATFRVFFSGCPRPEVTWLRYTFPIADSDAFQIHTSDTSSSLTVLDPRPDDSGVFTALLRNDCGSTKSSTNLNVVKAEDVEYVVNSSSSASQKTNRDARASTMSIWTRIWSYFSIFSFSTTENLETLM